mgnify:CR=1 FL=1
MVALVSAPDAVPETIEASLQLSEALLVDIGVPMGLSMVIMSLSGVVMMGLINREGVDTAAAYNAVNQMYGYIQMPAFAVASGCNTA